MALPGIEPLLTALLALPVRALIWRGALPWPLRHVADELVCEVYDAALRTTCMGFLMSHVLVAFSRPPWTVLGRPL